MKKILGINIGAPSVRNKHVMDYDANVTLSFGEVVPLLTHFMNPSDKVKFSSKQLLRLASMPSPTFSRIKLDNRAVFVPMLDVFPNYESVISNTSTYRHVGNNYVVTKDKALPRMRVRDIMFSILTCDYFVESVVMWNLTTNAKLGNQNSFSEWLSSNQLPDCGVFSNPSYEDNGLWKTMDDIDMMDYLVYYNVKPHNAPKASDCLFGVRLNNRGRTLIKVLRCIGLSCDVEDNSVINILPILAYYKACFDLYADRSVTNWNTTLCYLLISKFNDDPSNRWNFLSSSDNLSNWVDFLLDVANVCYAEGMDYVSAHRNDNQLSSVVGSSPTSNVGNVIGTNGVAGNALNAYLTGAVSKFGLDALRILSRNFTKDSLIGGKIDNWIRAHYGDTLADSVFKDVSNIASWQVNADIDEVINSSDTLSENSGDVLGAKAGIGSGFGENGFSFESPTVGYLFVMSSVTARSGFSQGTSPWLLGVDRYTLPNSEFDALGYEITPRECIYDNNGISKFGQQVELGTHSFGYIPRYSGYKVCKNILAGDFSNRSTRASFDAYHLDRIINPYVRQTVNGVTTFSRRSLPLASYNWRQIGRNALTNFNRIFYNNGEYERIVRFGSPSEVQNFINNLPSYVVDDNFILQCGFSFTCWNKLKPLMMSFDTYDSNDDRGITQSVD